MIRSLFVFMFLTPLVLRAQNHVVIQEPSFPNWNLGREGDTLTFDLKLSFENAPSKRSYVIKQGKIVGMEIDSMGNFTWIPQYHLVQRLEKQKVFQIIVESSYQEGRFIQKNIDLVIEHTNRKPIVHDLKTFYVKFNTKNTFVIDDNTIIDEDEDQLVFIPNIETFPEGLNLNSNGEFTWEPSLTQFKKIKDKALFVDFYVQDQPAKTQTLAKLKIEATQLDLPPEITIIPKKDKYFIKENESVNIRFYLSDPNGEEDIQDFDFITNIPNFNKKSLVKNSSYQYEFIWTPGYEFVKDPADTLGFYIDFFALDKSQKREVKRISFNIKNTVNESEADQKNYALYYSTLSRAWELLEQLKEKEEQLKKAYSKARKGKKQRSVVNASIGATTGLSSVLSRGKSDTQKTISTIGGTTVLTIGTLEATEVIGKSMKDLIDRLNYVIEKKNEIQNKGDIYARDFSLKSARRSQDFLRKTDDFMIALSLKGLVALELSASWESKTKISETAISKSFKDFIVWQ
ncbi:MAG: hypothetical protein ACRCVT_10825 [Leadbetterella sp.]